ncbi:hypothetical protein MAPG_09801 [Magnaporthiopsis poae ATCC 64411]|uniref:Uncharacterized protein n=1 Tax=Magnaporthiopsis poae (strain ATCC 64411 / 73-15) TaxID=644358 RepID=A0A0C4EAW5_MAGP6|nr:hypothetical protein MAPG_09801 [Magnaporthiopsis poae ATCC 64411]
MAKIPRLDKPTTQTGAEDGQRATVPTSASWGLSPGLLMHAVAKKRPRSCLPTPSKILSIAFKTSLLGQQLSKTSRWLYMERAEIAENFGLRYAKYQLVREFCCIDLRIVIIQPFYPRDMYEFAAHSTTIY